MSLVDLVREDFGISGSGGRWYRSDVHSSLVVDGENDLFFFNSRGLRGNALDYLVQVRGLDKRSAQDFLRNKTAGMPVDASGVTLQAKFEKLVDLFHSSGKQDRDYWYQRMLTDSTIDRYRLGNFDGWNLIPIYDKGLFINFQCRKDTPEKRIRFWYKDADFRPVLFNKEILPFIEKVYIVEGMVDCLLLNQLGLPSVCSTNGAMSWNPGWIQYFNKIKDIVYCADNDSAGIAGAYSVANSLGLYKVKILRFKEETPKFGALDYFRSGGTVKGFLDIVKDNSVYGFERSQI
jgi:DNA primase